MLSSCGAAAAAAAAIPLRRSRGRRPPLRPRRRLPPARSAPARTGPPAQLNEWYLFPETLPASLNPAAYATRRRLYRRPDGDRPGAGPRPLLHLSDLDRGGERLLQLAGRAPASESASPTTRRRIGSSSPRPSRAHRRSPPGSTAAPSCWRSAPAPAICSRSASSWPQAARRRSATRSGRRIRASPGCFGSAIRPAPRDVTVTKADYELTPVSSRYGAKIIDDGGRKVGYVNLRTFINTADPALRNAFAELQGAGRHRHHRRRSLQWRRPRLDRRADRRPDGRRPLAQRRVQLHHLPAGEIVEQLDPLLPAAAAVDRSDPDRLHRHRPPRPRPAS